VANVILNRPISFRRKFLKEVIYEKPLYIFTGSDDHLVSGRRPRVG